LTKGRKESRIVMAKKGTKGKAKRAASKAKKSKRSKAETVGASKADAALVKSAKEKEVGSRSWKPELEGDAIVGDVLSYGKGISTRYGEATVLVLGTPDGAYTVYCNAGLERGLDDLAVTEGDRVAIVFKGKVKTKRGRPFKLFAVEKADGKKRKTRKR